MTKKEILHKILDKEWDKINEMEENDFVSFACEWFQENCEYDNVEDLKQSYIADFMRYREDESEEELSESYYDLIEDECFHCGKELGKGDNDCDHCINESDLTK